MPAIMSGDLTQQRLARAVMRHLADTRGPDDPMGSLAHTVLSGEATLHEAANASWHGEGLAVAFQGAVEELRGTLPEKLAEYERDAARLRESVDSNDCAEDGP
jgi:hypothetical protein